MLITSRSKEIECTIMNITIESSTFSAGTKSPGVTIETAGYEQEILMVALNSSSFSKNEYGSLHITNGMHIVVENCRPR